mmetsp:Transcript_9216/g.28521  ORF Transcript_9216/g.28521 Transcript_9216/m.28521 type:complete len:106 (-) Transcript_9216:29-346(-)
MAEQIRRNSEILISQRNADVVSKTRLLLSLVIGAAAGILELTSQGGFIFYLISTLLLTVVHWFRLGGTHRDHFDSLLTMISSGVFPALLSFILSWTLVFNLVHIY